MGRTEQAMVLLLGVFIRPATMVLGLITAVALSYAAIYLVNLTFAYVFTQGLSSVLAMLAPVVRIIALLYSVELFILLFMLTAYLLF